MASLRDIRRNIKSVKSTQQITYAMKMVAAARIRKAQSAILSSRPFAVKMAQMIEDLHQELVDGDIRKSAVYNLSAPRPEAAAAGLVFITSDKGLCGAFNTNLIKAAIAWLRKNEKKKIYAFVAGKKARDFVRRLKLDIEVVHESVGIFPRVGYVHAELLGKALLEAYGKYPIGSVTLIYNEFKSMMSQKVVETELLPLGKLEGAGGLRQAGRFSNFLFEPEKTALLESLLPRYVKGQLYRFLLESQAAELSARMNAMESASKNASELIESLTLKLNRLRQSMITKELSEIVSGAEALNG